MMTIPQVPRACVAAVCWLLMAAAPAIAQPHLHIDTPGAGAQLAQPFMIAGWTVDWQPSVNSGIDAVHVYAAGPIGPGVFLGAAQLGIARPDVGQAFGQPRFNNSGYQFVVNGLPAGNYTFGLFAHSSVSGGWGGPYIFSATIHGAPLVYIDAITTGLQPFVLTGAAGDPQAVSDSGVSTVHVYANPVGGGAATFLGAAQMGVARPDIAAQFGQQFLHSGWQIPVTGLPPGQYTIAAYALGSYTGQWGALGTPIVAIQNNVRYLLEAPQNESSVLQPFAVSGGAADLAASPGSTGIDAVHVYARRVGASNQILLGAATYGIPRPDLAQQAGSAQFTNVGFSLPGIASLAPGAYDLITYLHSTVSGAWTAVVTRIYVDQRVAAPVASPPSGEYGAPITVQISTATPNATIRFTTDGSEPTEQSPAYTGPIQLASSGSGRVKAFRQGFIPSETVSLNYTFRAATPRVSPPSGTYEGEVTVVATSDTPGAVIRYSMSGADPTESSEVLTGPVTLRSSVSFRLRAFRPGWAPSAVLSGTYSIIPGAPVFSIPSGSYTAPQTVAMTTITSGATIRYTLDGSEPTTGSAPYSGPLLIARPSTLKARAFDAAGAGSSTSLLALAYETLPPVFTPPGGTLTDGPVNVSVTSATPGAVVRFTENGSEPTEASPVWSGQRSLSANAVFKAKAFKEGWPASETAEAVYVFQVATPTVEPVSGTYASPLSVSAASSTSQTVLRYTINGSDPTETSSVLAGSLVMPMGTSTLRVRAFRTGWSPSEVVTRSYLVASSVAPTPQVSPAPGVHDIGVKITMTVSGTATIRYTLDGTEPHESSPVYSSPITLTEPKTVRARAFRTGSVPSNIAGGDYVLRLPPPSVSPAAGQYSSAVTVAVSHSDSSTTRRYTTDREEPAETSTAVPTGGIRVTSTTTVKVRAFKTGWAPSNTVTRTYTVGGPPPPSPVTLQQTAPVPGQVVPAGSSVSIAAVGASLNAGSIAVFHNDVDVTARASRTASAITIPAILVGGLNTITIWGLDQFGLAVGASFDIVAASATLTVRVRSTGGAPLAGASARVPLPDYIGESQAFTNTSGVAVLYLPPNAPRDLTVEAAGYHTVFRNVGAAPAVDVFLSPINENFQAGFEDLEANFPSQAYFVSHIEGRRGWTCDPLCHTPTAADGTRAQTGNWGPAADVTVSDNDLTLTNWHLPAQPWVRRTFRPTPGAKSVTVRYKVASHTQQGFYHVSLRALRSNRYLEHATYMWALQQQGLAPPDFTYIESYWITLRLDLAPEDDEVQLVAALEPGRADGTLATWINIDQVVVEGLNLTTARLLDPHGPTRLGEDLQFLSVGEPDTASATTRVYGILTFSGSIGQVVSAVNLEVSDSSGVRARVPIKSDAAALVVNRPINSGALTTGASRELFEFTTGHMRAFGRDGEEQLGLRVVATDSAGRVVASTVQNARSVWKMTDIRPGVARYGTRDSSQCLFVSIVWPCLGDAWARPGVQDILRDAATTLSQPGPAGRQAEQLQVNDISNMNGGLFPGHNTHRRGTFVDALIEEYLNRDASVATRLIAVATELDRVATSKGWRLSRILVSFDSNDPFARALVGQTINGRSASDVIRRDPSTVHANHFHVEFEPPANLR